MHYIQQGQQRTGCPTIVISVLMLLFSNYNNMPIAYIQQGLRVTLD